MKYIDSFRNMDAAKGFRQRLHSWGQKLSAQDRSVCLMEVCGSHTMAIARFGIRDFLPDNTKLISGPGCPVCVTDNGYIDTAIALAEQGMIIATFGDMVRVPGSHSNLLAARSEGAEIVVCYSPAEAITLAQENPGRQVVFLAVGFETSIAPAIAMLATVLAQEIDNLTLLTAFKLIPPALATLANDAEIQVDGLLCPAHVSAIIGANAYQPLVAKWGIPCVVAGFEPLDILYGLEGLLEQLSQGIAKVDNQYNRVVSQTGNVRAQRLMAKFLLPADALWRGLGVIPGSGLALRPQYHAFDATLRHKITIPIGKIPSNCVCGDVLKGKIVPVECQLFGNACTPDHPVGPCMVSSEGSCAACFKYERLEMISVPAASGSGA